MHSALRALRLDKCVLQCDAVCCNVLQCVAMHGASHTLGYDKCVLQCVAGCVTVCCNTRFIAYARV